MAEINLLDLYPKASKPVDERGKLITEDHRRVARQFGKEFFDGDRLFGYGGYSYHPRFWTDTVKRFKDHYKLAENCSVLDVGCGKGFMMHDFKKLMPKMTIAGIDVSTYAYENAMPDMKPFIKVADAKKLPYPDKSFDLVIALNTIHNLPLTDCEQSLREISRVSRGNAFLVVDAWRDEAQHQRMLMWNLTALTYMHVDDWQKFFKKAGYHGDYYWTLV